ncbi:hypothetical protein J7T55_001081 [Diaporthe amygdali]|uniref:uncharacterized protein n=1 Tax=Phomopsis amygdali TaxID=1214568 RepID=UPI0022FF01B3|nr:uncharacterized protein J7T55_001081 [Diaporthe amygdali]KAJ0120224.1 hypothetical protein J7T55_001081 [Diaporthe amygdali]
MASQLYERMVASLPQLVRRSDDFEPYNYTSKNGHVCAMPRPLTNTETAKLAGGYDFFTINQIVTGACACFTLLSLFILMFRHATHLSRPNEQLNILRICCYLPIFAIGCFLEVSFPNAYMYINPWLDFVQSLALCNFFLLMCQFVSPSDQHREVFFAALKVPQKKKKGRGGRRARGRGGDYGPEPEVEEEPINGLEWYRKMWMLIFQYPAVQALVAIFTAIFESQGVYCLASSKPYFGHLWLDIIHNVSLTLAIMSCLRLYGALKSRLAHHKPLAKLAAFKLLVAITGIIQLIYWILRSISPSPLKPTAYFSWSDDFIGIPVMVMALLTVPFSVFFHFAYDVKPYYLENAGKHLPLAQADLESGSASGSPAPASKPAPYTAVGAAGTRYQGGFLGIWAWLGMLNPSELISGFVFGFTMLSKENRKVGVNTVRRAQTGEFGQA